MKVNDVDIPAHEIKGTDLGNVDQFVRQHKQVQGAILIYIDHEGFNTVSSYRTAWAKELMDELYHGMRISTRHLGRSHDKLQEYMEKNRKHKGEKHENSNNNPETPGE